MKVLIDMNLSPRWATVLTHAGLEAVHWSRLGSGESYGVREGQRLCCAHA